MYVLHNDEDIPKVICGHSEQYTDAGAIVIWYLDVKGVHPVSIIFRLHICKLQNIDV